MEGESNGEERYEARDRGETRERKRCRDCLQLSDLLWAISLRYKFSTVNLKYKDNL